MRSLRTGNALFRVIVAAIFGVVSLSHGPVMAFAQVNAQLAAREMTIEPVAGHHHHVAAPIPANEDQEQPTPSRKGVAICYSAGCFIVVAPAPISAPAVLFSLLERLCAAPAAAMVPAILDPLVPPPRLQA
jgi:hypothetical protein